MINTQNLLDQFRLLCEREKANPNLEEINFFDMSLGFFLALGATFIEAYNLALSARYDHEYWSNSSEPIV